MKRKMYLRNTESIYTLSSIVLDPLIEDKTYRGGWLYASRSGGGGIHSVSPFSPMGREFWFVLRGIEATLEFNWSSAIPEFIAELDKDVDNPVFHIDCDEGDVMVRLI